MTSRKITPAIRQKARAYEIWCHCNARKWDCTMAEVAEALSLTVKVVRSICAVEGWTRRLQAEVGHENEARDLMEEFA
ncbi:hypothetical protein [Falsirhodobacter halotolerans]|uniref:hypothetical protein n=1 Tax=Falsirhodobacter halotolerans TaxID=1146892 RepID=UPI001FD5E16A|nr:hypothetical protein [Falsirhodobacter halotolerans]MCJ8139377.1 hypothetical protein [Falsirhodobacter halotolerans]